MANLVENYEKGATVELQDDSGLEFDSSVVHMQVKQGSSIQKLMGYALRKIREPGVKQLTWNGCGPAVSKSISCAEIMKRKIKGLHQITKLRFKRTEETWEPKQEGLERLKVNHDIPSITILLSLEPLDESEAGYQAPGNIDPFWKRSIHQSAEKRNAQGHKMQDDKNRKLRRAGNSSLEPPSMDNPRKKKPKRKDGTGGENRTSNRRDKNKQLTDQQTNKQMTDQHDEAMQT